MKQYTTILNHKGKNIIYTDLTDVTPEQAIESVDGQREKIQACLENSALCLTNLTEAKYNKDALAAMLKLQKDNRPFVRKSAVIGISGVKKTIFDTYNILSDRDIKTFDDIEAAKDWLVEL